MSYKITTSIIVTALDPEDECDPRDLEAVGMVEHTFTCDRLDDVVVHSTGLKSYRDKVGFRFPDQYQFELQYPEEARVESLA